MRKDARLLLFTVFVSLTISYTAAVVIFTLQSSKITIVFDNFVNNNDNGIFSIKPAFAIQTNLLPFNSNINNFYQFHYTPNPAATTTPTTANQLINGWIGQCSRTTALPNTANFGSTYVPFLGTNAYQPHCYNQYLQSYIDQINGMNLFAQCLPIFQMRNLISNIHGLAPYCDSVIGTTAIPQLSGQVVPGQEHVQLESQPGSLIANPCINNQCQTSSSISAGEPSTTAVNQQTTCSNNICQTTTCINNQCQTSSSGESSGNVVYQQTTCSNNICQTTTCINNQCQTSSSDSNNGGQSVGDINNQNQNIIAKQTVDQRQNCVYGPSNGQSCLNNPTSVQLQTIN